MKKPVIAVTMGDPAGIGPEIILKGLVNPAITEVCSPMVIGDLNWLRFTAKTLNLSVKMHLAHSVAECKFTPGTLEVMDLKNVNMEHCKFGVLSPENGVASYRYIEDAVRLAMSRRVDAIVTAPITKEALAQAGYPYIAHTEIIAHLTGSVNPTMMLCNGKLNVTHVSTHVSLRNAIEMVKTARVLDVIKMTDGAIRKFGVENPRIAVAGLNPHAGENGLFGTEELREIIPAIQAAQAQGIQASGPYSADAVFPHAAAGRYDAVVAMYHDQGHIPLKTLDFKYEGSALSDMSGVNISLGLPITRVSVEHGTAYDIAGKGVAVVDSFLSAIQYAVKLAK